MIEILNEGNFPEKVLQAPHKVLVEFFAAWCPHCQRMMPVVEQVKELLQGRVKVYQFDIDENKSKAGEAYGARALPGQMLLFYRPSKDIPTGE